MRFAFGSLLTERSRQGDKKLGVFIDSMNLDYTRASPLVELTRSTQYATLPLMQYIIATFILYTNSFIISNFNQIKCMKLMHGHDFITVILKAKK